MPKYDAFGRELGEDPLAGLRAATNPVPAEEKEEPVAARAEPVAWPDPVAARPEPAAAVRPEPAAAARPEPAAARPDPVVAAPRAISVPSIEFVRPQRRRRGIGGLIMLVAIVGGVGLAVNAGVEKSGDLIERITPDELQSEPEPAPTGLGARSLVRQSNFAGVIRQLTDADLGRPMAIRIAPDRVDATLLKGRTRHQVQVTADGELRDFGSSQGTGQAMSFTKIDPAAPERLVRRAATPKHPPKSIDYVLINAGTPPTTGAYFKRGRIVIGDVHGRPQRVL